jgi:hypothetical protein
MMEEKNMTPQESLQLISRMIETAKKEQAGNGKGWITWGWLLFLASGLSFLNLQTKWFNQYFFWNAFGFTSVALLILLLLRSSFLPKRVKVKTYTSELFPKLHVGFFISLLFIILAMNLGVPPVMGFALLINLYAFWVLIYGATLNFLPSLVGAFAAWILGFASLFVEQFQWVMVFHGLAVLCGFIIPGHIANYQFNLLRKKENLAARV